MVPLAIGLMAIPLAMARLREPRSGLAPPKAHSTWAARGAARWDREGGLPLRGGGNAFEDSAARQSVVVAALTWLGAGTAWGSLGLFSAALSAGDKKAKMLKSCLVVLLLGIPCEILTSRIGQRADSVIRSRRGTRALELLCERLHVLSHALQALAMASCAVLTFSIAWISTKWKFGMLSLAAVPGALVGSGVFSSFLRRTPVAAHLWVPFIIILTAAHVGALDMLASVQANRFNFICSVWTAVAGVAAIGALRLLAWQAALLANPPASPV